MISPENTVSKLRAFGPVPDLPEAEETEPEPEAMAFAAGVAQGTRRARAGWILSGKALVGDLLKKKTRNATPHNAPIITAGVAAARIQLNTNLLFSARSLFSVTKVASIFSMRYRARQVNVFCVHRGFLAITHREANCIA